MEFSLKLFILVLLLPIIARCSEHFIDQECSKNFSIIDYKSLQDNINYTFFDLLAKTSIYNFAISSYGNDLDTIYGLTRCRGDVSQETCTLCILEAAKKIRTVCPFSAEAQIWYEHCFLRYDTNNFLGQLDMFYTQIWYDENLAPNPYDFDQAVWRLLGEVKVDAAMGDNKFGQGESNLLKNMTIYGMAQCTRDLQESTCKQCLENLTGSMSREFKYHLGCYAISTSCVLRYEVNPFLNESVAPSPNAYAPTSP